MEPFYEMQGWEDQAVRHCGKLPLLIPDGTQSFDYLEIGAGSEVVLVGPATVTAQAIMAGPDSRLLLDTTNGPIDLVVTGFVAFQPGSRLETSSDDPLQASVLFAGVDTLSGPGVDIEARSQFHGSIVAPSATVHIGPEFELFGALAASALEIEPGVRLHFDHALADPNSEGASRPQVISWRVVDIPLEVNARSLSPFDLLGLVRSDLDPPAQAHADQALSIQYLDQNGNTASYEGSEKDFDWSTVSEVTSATRDGDEVIDTAELSARDPIEEPTGGEPAPADPESLGELAAMVADPWSTMPRELLNLALALSPLPESDLQSTISIDFFNNNEMTELIDAQNGMSEASLAVLLAVENLGSAHLRNVLLNHSPLPASILATVIEGNTRLASHEILVITDAQ